MLPIPRILFVDDRREAKATELRLKYELLVDVDLMAGPGHGLGALLGSKAYVAAIICGTFADSKPPREADNGPELVDLFLEMCRADTTNRAIPICFLCGDPQELAAVASEETRGMSYFRKSDQSDWVRLLEWLVSVGVSRRTQGSEPAVRTGT